MKKTIISTILTLIIGIVSASAQTDHCFKNNGLKTSNTISFTVKGNKIIDGEFESGNYEGTTSAETYHFTGTKIGNTLTIKFSGTIPEEFKKVGKIVWTLGKSLKVKASGKNYNTKKWSIYAATYEKCEV